MAVTSIWGTDFYTRGSQKLVAELRTDQRSNMRDGAGATVASHGQSLLPSESLSLRWHILPSDGNFRAPLHLPLARSVARSERLVEMVASVWQWLSMSLSAVYFFGTVALRAGLSQRVM